MRSLLLWTSEEGAFEDAGERAVVVVVVVVVVFVDVLLLVCPQMVLKGF